VSEPRPLTRMKAREAWVMRIRRVCAFFSVAALVAGAAPYMAAQLIHVETSGVVDSITGSDLSLVSGANVGDAWHTMYSFSLKDVPLAGTGINWATYHTPINVLATAKAGAFSATAMNFALTVYENESLGLHDGTLAHADMLQFSGYAPTAGVFIQTSLFYPVGTLNRFSPIVPSFAPSIISLDLLVLIDGWSALVESYAELRSLDPPLRPVPEPGTYGWAAAFALCGAIAVRAAGKRRSAACQITCE
jgi:hypothetical protein